MYLICIRQNGKESYATLGPKWIHIWIKIIIVYFYVVVVLTWNSAEEDFIKIYLD
jgi:hypothetical protein